MNPEVAKVMTRGLITIGVDASMVEAYEKMRRYGIRHLPVTDEAGDLIGLLSDRDVQRAMVNKKNDRVVMDHTFEFDPRHSVKDFMSFPLCTVQPHFSIARVAQMMVDEKKSAFVVVSRERGVQGIITTDDLLLYLASLLDKDPIKVHMPLSALIDEYKLDGAWVE